MHPRLICVPLLFSCFIIWSFKSMLMLHEMMILPYVYSAHSAFVGIFKTSQCSIFVSKIQWKTHFFNPMFRFLLVKFSQNTNIPEKNWNIPAREINTNQQSMAMIIFITTCVNWTEWEKQKVSRWRAKKKNEKTGKSSFHAA